MRISSCFVISTLCLTACVSEDGLDEVGDVGESAEPATDLPPADPGDADAFSYCVIPPNPPNANITFDLDAIQNPVIYAVQNYGTGACSAHTSAWVGQGSMRAYVPESSTPEACVGTTLYVRKYLRDYAGWQLWDTRTIHGEWTANGCVTDSVSAGLGDSYPSEIRVWVKVHRKTCSGQYCATQYGVPFRLSGTP